MSGILSGRFYIKEFHAATEQQKEMEDIRIDSNGDIEYECQYNIVKRNNKYLITDTVFTCASYDSLEELMEDMILERNDVSWVRSP